MDFIAGVCVGAVFGSLVGVIGMCLLVVFGPDARHYRINGANEAQNSEVNHA